MGAVAERISRKLHDGLSPESLEVRDESAKHAGHAGARPEGETHFDVRVVAAAFAGLSRLERQRLVNGLLREELAGPVHALSLKLLAPAEA
ncbi:MAG: BolA family transcriptional regulator [Caulobacteraceae bacterium]|nr:BolA family transcriptional regulator [Caulobacteraceae bacterium]